VFGILKQQGQRIEIVDAVPPEDILSINDPQQLAEVDAILRARLGLKDANPAAGHSPLKAEAAR
jgi:hypothetical protein